MIVCDNSDHDGARVSAAAVILVDGAPDRTRCTYCAEGVMTSLVRQGLPFRVQPVDA